MYASRTLAFGICLAAMSGTTVAQNQGKQPDIFLRASSPQENEDFAPGADCNVLGFVVFADKNRASESLFVRARLYGPSHGDFVIDAEGGTPLGKLEAGRDRLAFKSSLRLPAQAGRYLLVVDCLDLNAPKYPKNLVANQALFINLKAGARQ